MGRPKDPLLLELETGCKSMVQGAIDSLISNLQGYSQVQNNGWLNIWSLAVKAHARNPSSSRYKLAAEGGYWAITLPSEKHWPVYVELLTGRLVNGLNTNEAPNKSDLLQLANSLDQLDTEKIIADLERILEKEQ